MRTRLLGCLLLAALAACEGPVGPAGPEGPVGPQGPQGPQGTTRLLLTAPANASGIADAFLPAAASNGPSNPPAMSCYASDSPTSGFWIAVNDGFWVANTPWCALGWTQSGVWNAHMENLPVGWTAAFVIVY